MFWRKHRKNTTFTVPIEKEATKIDENGEEIKKYKYNIYHNLLIAQGLCRSHYQILSITIMKEFIKLNVNMNTMIKNVKLVELEISIEVFFIEYLIFKDDLIEYKCLCSNNNYQQKFDEKLKGRLFKTYKFSNNEHTASMPLLMQIRCTQKNICKDFEIKSL